MNWKKLLLSERFAPPNTRRLPDNTRTPFETDVDRVTFCSGFRRLAKKTQVHPFSSNDHVRTRLTHSIEVAGVGRSLGNLLGKRIHKKLPKGITPADLGAIVQAACLAHDLGNPPFGHAGEEAMLQWFESYGSSYLSDLTPELSNDIKFVEGNAQGFRMITQTENHLFEGGLRLTYATLGAFLKYPWSSRYATRAGDKFGSFLTEETILDDVGKRLGLVQIEGGKWCRHPLAYLVEAADDICYATLDLEDAVELGILPYKKVEKILLSGLKSTLRDAVEKELDPPKSYRVNFLRLRGPVFAALITATIDAFLSNYDDIMSGNFNGSLWSSLSKRDPRKTLIAKAKGIAKKHVYPSQRKLELELGCFSVFDCLLDAHCKAARECPEHLYDDGQSKLSWRSGLVLKLIGNHAPSKKNAPKSNPRWTRYLCMRRVLDYVIGMTDNYARHIAQQLRGAGT